MNMKQVGVMAAILTITALPAQAAHTPRAGHGESQSYAATIGAKAGYGVMNTATGWMEIPKTMITTSHSDGIGMGLSAGFFKGLANMLGRTLMGVVDITTFPIPTKPMVDPSTVWQNFDQETRFSNSWEMYETR